MKTQKMMLLMKLDAVDLAGEHQDRLDLNHTLFESA